MSTMALPVIDDLHTSDLTCECLRRVYHRHRGEWSPEGTTALVRGQMFGEAAARIHTENGWDEPPEAAVMHAIGVVRQTAKAEGRSLSDSVERNMHTIGAEVQKAVKAYVGRFATYFGKAKLIGCEVPIRCEIDGQEFASHLDLFFRGPDGGLSVWDWKWREEAPTREYLNRNLQLGLYWWAVAHGEVQIDGEWIAMQEHPFVSWFHVPHLFPYKRKTGDANAGDERGLERIVMPVEHNDEGALLDELRLRIRMMEAGMWPTNPDPIGCYLCESKRWCPSFDGRHHD